MKPLITAVLLALGAVLLEASSLEDFRVEFNGIGSEIDELVKTLRAENSDAISEMNRKVLQLLGNYSIEIRNTLYYANGSIQVDEWLNENPDAQRCFDWAYYLLNLYSVVATWDIEWCATYAQRETSTEAQYHFYAHAHYIMRVGTNGRGRVLESFELQRVYEEQLEFLDKELEELKYLWDNYQTVLKEEIARLHIRADQIAETLDVCLQNALDSIKDTVQYIEDDLKSCLKNVESSGP